MTKFKWEAARKRDLLRRSNEDRLSRQELLRQQRAARKKKSTGGAVGVSKADRLASKKKTIAKVESYSVPKICSERVSALNPYDACWHGNLRGRVGAAVRRWACGLCS
jgi:hypothetical protein